MQLWLVAAKAWRVIRRVTPLRAAALAILEGVPGLHRWVARIRSRLGRMPAYEDWMRDHDTLHASDVAAIRAHVADMPHRLISVVMPVYNTDERLLREAIGSVVQQFYPHWELCIADDASTLPHVRKVLEEFAGDSRIKLVWRPVNGHISAATNSALALARGEFVALMDHDDVLPPHALYEVAATLLAEPETDLIYSDEDKMDGDGRRFEPYFKPDWNYDLLLGQNYINHLSVFRRSLLQQVGGLRQGFEGSQDHDLVLRIIELTQPHRIRHIPSVLYHWRQGAVAGSFSEVALAQCIAAARRAVAEHLERTGRTGTRVEPHPAGLPWLRVIWPLTREPLVSIIVPTRNHAALLARIADDVLHRTDYENFELIIVDNQSNEQDALALLEELQRDRRVKLLRFPGPFNYSAINNRAVAKAAGDVIVMLNNDIEVIDGGWLREMVSHAMRPDVGAVGAKLLYSDNTVQHAGVALGVKGTTEPIAGVAGHLGLGMSREETGYFGHIVLARQISSVTAACLAVRREVYLSAGGLDEENLPVAFNDVDLCLRIAETGLRNIWTPFAELYHLESASRGSDMTPRKAERFARECAYMRRRWGATLDNDPFYNPNFTLDNADHRVARPRRLHPWQLDPPVKQRSLPSTVVRSECVGTERRERWNDECDTVGQSGADPLPGSRHQGAR
jgi:glycosyltransferase involved in cell wall biosynthesis